MRRVAWLQGRSKQKSWTDKSLVSALSAHGHYMVSLTVQQEVDTKKITEKK